ncbi:iron ABC transporter permease [Citrobacter freundii]|uniref:FecCD family ABC transporter permease n=1 Tax=Citrobacter freundii TaxID=546 RepID=UPI0015E9BC04|nr:iron ABC transporter permease [Citrobacter freundii]QLY69937.1 iron ABC transporter permease [Citrobacter freundii]
MSELRRTRRAMSQFTQRTLLHSLWVSVVMCGVLLAGISIGETFIPWQHVTHTLANHLFGSQYPVDALDAGIIWNYRLTRALVSACCGACLAVSGVVLQSLLRNALAEPYLLGISAGASTGAVLIALTGLGAGIISMSLGAFIGALTAFLFVALLAVAARGKNGSATTQIILAGIASSQLFNAITSLIITRSANAEQARGIMFWLLGNLSGVRWPDVVLAIPTALVGIIACFCYARHLDAFSFGAESAASLGIPVKRTRAVLITAVTGMTAIMVSIVGAIGFVGLVIPHAARLLVGNQHHRLLPVSALIGAIFLIVADVISRTLLPGQVLPIGVITALVGAPAFSIILIRGNPSK